MVQPKTGWSNTLWAVSEKARMRERNSSVRGRRKEGRKDRSFISLSCPQNHFPSSSVFTGKCIPQTLLLIQVIFRNKRHWQKNRRIEGREKPGSCSSAPAWEGLSAATPPPAPSWEAVPTHQLPAIPLLWAALPSHLGLL